MASNTRQYRESQTSDQYRLFTLSVNIRHRKRLILNYVKCQALRHDESGKSMLRPNAGNRNEGIYPPCLLTKIVPGGSATLGHHVEADCSELAVNAANLISRADDEAAFAATTCE